MVEPGLSRMVHNVLNGGMEGLFPTVLKSSLPALSCPAHAVLWYNKILQPEGLFPSRTPDAKVYCLSHQLKDRWVLRTLTITEKLRLYQLPVFMNAALSGLCPNGWLPFADAPSPEIYASILLQFLGADVGGKWYFGFAKSHYLAISPSEDSATEKKVEKES